MRARCRGLALFVFILAAGCEPWSQVTQISAVRDLPGTLEVALRSTSGGFSGQALVEDIDHLELDLTTRTGTTPLRIASGSIRTGEATASFQGVIPGPATLTARALGAGDAVLGTASGSYVIPSGGAIAATLSLRLQDTPGGNVHAEVVLQDGRYLDPALTSPQN